MDQLSDSAEKLTQANIHLLAAAGKQVKHNKMHKVVSFYASVCSVLTYCNALE